MTRKDAIIARRAIRTYTQEPLKDSQLADLRQFIGTVKPLHSTIKTSISILSREDFVRGYRSVFAPVAQHYLVIRSVCKEGYLENAGFIGEQIVLYLVEHEIGTCWIGATAPKNTNEPGLFPYVVTICFGRPDNAPRRQNAEEANRKLLHEVVMGKISNPALLPLLEAGRLAPSAMNFQPVRYITENTNIFVYRKRPFLPIGMIERMQCIDVGVALANIYIAGGEDRVFIREKNFPTPHGNCVYEYTVLDASTLDIASAPANEDQA